MRSQCPFSRFWHMALRMKPALREAGLTLLPAAWMRGGGGAGTGLSLNLGVGEVSPGSQPRWLRWVGLLKKGLALLIIKSFRHIRKLYPPP